MQGSRCSIEDDQVVLCAAGWLCNQFGADGWWVGFGDLSYLQDGYHHSPMSGNRSRTSLVSCAHLKLKACVTD